MMQRDPRMVGGIYRIGQSITSGPVHSMYTAYNRNTNNVVGLLILELPSQFDFQVVERLLHPLERRRSVQSPHVLRVYDWGIDGSRVYITTDPPRGVLLRYVLENENISVQLAISLAKQLAQGLSLLQAHGIVDLDLRPQLITVDIEGDAYRVQLDDVGLRSFLRKLGYVASPQADDPGSLDPRYLPPESIEGREIGPWSDVYQFGVVFFELLTGRVPFVGRTAIETQELQCTAPIPRLAQFKQDAHEILAVVQEIVDRALAKKPADRFPHAPALLSALEAVRIPAFFPDPGGKATNEMRYLSNAVVSSATSSTPDLEATIPPSSTTEGAYAYLCAEKEGVETQRFALNENTIVVGRIDPKRGVHPDIDLSLHDPGMTVSRQHARIRYENNNFFIEDLKSSNKTRVGEVILPPLKPEPLHNGDIVQFGAVRLVFRVPEKLDKHDKTAQV